MVLNVALFLLGVIVAGAALRDVFDTVAVPGGSEARLKVVRRLVWLSLPAWKRWRGGGITTSFAPLILVVSFVIWMCLLALGFGLMALALRGFFHPHLRNLPDAVYLVGTAMTTIGRGGVTVAGPARWVVVSAGFCGLAVMTLAITYLLEVQSGIGQRDSGIIKLNTSAGDPPSAVRLLERFAAIGNRAQLIEVMRDARNWCATVRQSHVNRPSLIYFRSIGSGAGWPAALGAVIDLSLLFEFLLDDDGLRGPALLLGEDATQLAIDLAELIGLDPVAVGTAPDEARLAVEQLTLAGYRLVPGRGLAKFRASRDAAQSRVTAMAQHLGKPTAVLIPQAV